MTALDVSRDGQWAAVGRYATVAIYATSEGSDIAADGPRHVLKAFPGKVTAVHFTPDGARLVTASGVTGLGGVAAVWRVEDGSLIREFKGHRDLLHDAELSPDGTTLATCSYDREIRLWSMKDGAPIRTLAGHNGAVYDIAFSPDGRFLLSASADDTCKVWRVEDGLRMDTLPQPLKEEYSCAFSPDGKFIVAGGADNSIRVWEFVSRDKPRINPLVRARFAHESPIVRLSFTPDGSRLISLAEDRSIKVWETQDFTELRLWEKQPDVATALAVSGDGASFRVGRMDGSLATYPIPVTVTGTERGDGDIATPAEAPVAAVPIRDGEVPRRVTEREPNNNAAQVATDVDLPAEIRGTIAGRVAGEADVDLFGFSAKAGEEWVIEVNAARSKSKLDSFIEVLDARGGRIPRLLLQAVRDSYFTFRGKDDSTIDDFRIFNWEEMRLNEYLYANGEVVRLWLYPRGPDSGFQVYPGQGKRWGFFDTTPLAHALGEPCYVVEPHPPGAKLVANGLPVFPLYHDNDDDAHRELGEDSRLYFTAPSDGRYLVKVKDVRGQEGPAFTYTLTIRPRHPDFRITLQRMKSPIGAGGAQEFKVTAQRIDGFEGPIRVEIDGLPPGFSATTPLIIEAGQIEALGVVAADDDATAPTPEAARASRVTASGEIGRRDVTHPVGSLGEIKLAAKPKLRVKVAPAEDGAQPIVSSPGKPMEFEIHPGQTIHLKLKVERDGNVGAVPFGKEGAGRNLPFGVIVDNLGLNGLLILADQDERTFFITADRSVPRQTRHFHLNTTAAGGQASHPVILHVR